VTDKEEVSSYWMTIRKERILSIERGNIRLDCAKNLLWKRLWTCHNTDCRMNGFEIVT